MCTYVVVSQHFPLVAWHENYSCFFNIFMRYIPKMEKLKIIPFPAGDSHINGTWNGEVNGFEMHFSALAQRSKIVFYTCTYDVYLYWIMKKLLFCPHLICW